MKTIVVYKDNTDHARAVIDYMHDFHRMTGKELEVVDPDTRDGSAFCEVYDIVQYPTLIAVDDSGRMVQTWPGLPLPRISEVSYYVN